MFLKQHGPHSEFDIQFSMFWKWPFDVQGNNDFEATKEIVFLRHNLAARHVYARCWQIHRSMLIEYVQRNWDTFWNIAIDFESLKLD
jgi:hypothetical protein